MTHQPMNDQEQWAKDPLKTLARLGDAQGQAASQLPPLSDTTLPPLNLDLAPGNKSLLNYLTLIEVCFLPPGGKRLVVLSPGHL